MKNNNTFKSLTRYPGNFPFPDKIHSMEDGNYRLQVNEIMKLHSCSKEKEVSKIILGEFGKFAHLATVDLDKEEVENDLNSKLLNTPIIPSELYSKLPDFLQRSCQPFKHSRERDLFITGALTVLSGCMSSVSGTYDQRTVYPNIYSFIIAPAASGKGALALAKELAMTCHRKLLLESKENMRVYQLEMDQFKAAKRSKSKEGSVADDDSPIKPKFKILYIPANSSSAAVIGHLEQSDGVGIICETEADTMANTLKADFGGYSDLLRKAFHHEPITYSRKTNAEFVEVEKPRISIALSGTPSQVQGLIGSAEDGLFSRFIFYTFRLKPVWRDVSPSGKVNLTEYFDLLSQEVERMVSFLEMSPTTFNLTPKQWQFLNSHFDLWLREVSVFFSEDASSTVKRLALIVYRIAMILSAIRKFEEGVIDKDIYCTENDFHTSFSLAETYKQHALLMFASLPKSQEIKLEPNKKKFFDALPNEEFTRHQAVEIGASIGIRERTIGKYLNNFLGSFLEQPFKYGPYLKRAS